MKKLFTSFLFVLLFVGLNAQSYWQPAVMQGKKIREATKVTSYYSLDLNQLRSKLASAVEQSKNAKSVEITLPTLEGKMERFAVYSCPVVVKSLADQYQLGSYVGIGIDDPTKRARFSVAPNDFQSMIMKDGKFEFIEPQNAEKTVYGVHPKTTEGGEHGFLCSMNENILSKKQIDELFESGKAYSNNGLVAKAFDKKYRTMRLALSVTGEYTTYFGGVAGALTQMNATMTRVNGVLEKDLTLQLILQNFPALIYTDAATDPYSAASTGAGGAWNTELQNTLTNTIGNAAYDIGHLFGATGGGGNAGCIGCVCVDDTTSTTDKNKGSGFTSPADGIPSGDNFDIDYVVHEMGHQLGANHTFSHSLESYGMNVEPGSGTTIMGYAGITGSTTDVAPHSDPYFSIVSQIQIDNNLALSTKTCDIETAVANNPPVITPMADVTIPKGTAFVLTAQATDPENDPITYDWEEVDNASVTINKTNLGTTSSGASFRALAPSTSPKRYFPRESSVLSGVLDNSNNNWEAVSTVARNTNFRVTVRDNSPSVLEQQVAHSLQKVVVGADGPFKVTSTKVYNNTTDPLTWAVVNTNNATYGVSNVKIDYTTDNGATWTVLAASTPNDGSESLDFSALPTNSNIKVRVSAIGNVFYAIGNVLVSAAVACDGTAPAGLVVSGITTAQAVFNWDAIAGATYIVRYKKVADATWTEVPVSTNTYTVTSLAENTAYEVQVAAVCSSVTGSYSASVNFSTLILTYCTMTASNSTEEYISNVTVGSMVSNSGATNYTDYSSDNTRVVNLIAGSTTNTISVTKAWQATQFNETVTVWIDFNRDGTFDTTEKIMATAADKTTPVTATFTVPAGAYTGGQSVKMRVVLKYSSSPTNACTNYTYGEVEDYKVMITAPILATDEVSNKGVQVYPNPATDILNITKVSNKANYAIYNANGQIVAKGNVSNTAVPVSKLEKGVYIISVTDNGQTSKVKFIKK